MILDKFEHEEKQYYSNGEFVKSNEQPVNSENAAAGREQSPEAQQIYAEKPKKGWRNLPAWGKALIIIAAVIAGIALLATAATMR